MFLFQKKQILLLVQENVPNIFGMVACLPNNWQNSQLNILSSVPHLSPGHCFLPTTLLVPSMTPYSYCLRILSKLLCSFFTIPCSLNSLLTFTTFFTPLCLFTFLFPLHPTFPSDCLKASLLVGTPSEGFHTQASEQTGQIKLLVPFLV